MRSIFRVRESQGSGEEHAGRGEDKDDEGENGN